jgi:hypothetical protein
MARRTRRTWRLGIDDTSDRSVIRQSDRPLQHRRCAATLTLRRGTTRLQLRSLVIPRQHLRDAKRIVSALRRVARLAERQRLPRIGHNTAGDRHHDPTRIAHVTKLFAEMDLVAADVLVTQPTWTTCRSSFGSCSVASFLI